MKPWRSTFLTNGVIFAAGLVGGVLAARFLGAEDRGLLAAITYWPHFIAGVAAMGLNEGIVIRTAKSGTTATLRATTFAISLGLALLLGVIGYYLMPILLSESRQDYLLFSQLYFLVFLPFTFLAMNFLAVDQGELKFHHFNRQRIIQAVAYPLLLLGLWLVGILTVEFAAIAVLSGTVIVALLRVWNARSGLTKRPSLIEARQLFVMSFRLHLVNMVTFLAMQIDQMTLVFFSNNTQLGLYVVAFTSAGAVQSLFVTTYINIMLPTAAKIGSEKENIEEILVPLRKLLGIIMLCSIFLVFFVPYLIYFIFGAEFKSAGVYAQILVLAFLFVGTKKVLIYLLRSWRLNQLAIFSEGFTALVLISGSYLAIHWWGTIGLCVLVLLAHATGAMLLVYYFLKITGLRLKNFVQVGPIIIKNKL